MTGIAGDHQEESYDCIKHSKFKLTEREIGKDELKKEIIFPRLSHFITRPSRVRKILGIFPTGESIKEPDIVDL